MSRYVLSGQTQHLLSALDRLNGIYEDVCSALPEGSESERVLHDEFMEESGFNEAALRMGEALDRLVLMSVRDHMTRIGKGEL